MKVIEIPDKQAEALQAKAAEQGLTLEAWFEQIASHGTGGARAGVLDWSQCSAVESVPGKVSGAWVLKGTRMPVSAIFENLEAGANIYDILEWFPGLHRFAVEAVIEFAARSLDSPAARSR